MANTYTLIASNILGSSAASVTFSSIPNTYTDLVIKMSARSSANTDLIYLTLNSDSGTNYSITKLVGSGSAASSGRQSSQPQISLDAGIVPSSYTTNVFSNAEIYIPSYLVSQNKPISYFGANENNATQAYIATQANLWSNTAAITSATITAVSANFVSGSSFFLYGIKNS